MYYRFPVMNERTNERTSVHLARPFAARINRRHTQRRLVDGEKSNDIQFSIKHSHIHNWGQSVGFSTEFVYNCGCQFQTQTGIDLLGHLLNC